MKKLFLALLFLPMLSSGQAMVGFDRQHIENELSQKTFVADRTKGGKKYIKADFGYAVFYYYFNSDGISDVCCAVPASQRAVNTMVEWYNKDYVITGKKSWNAYLSGDAIMHITLNYDAETDTYYFQYEL